MGNYLDLDIVSCFACLHCHLEVMNHNNNNGV